MPQESKSTQELQKVGTTHRLRNVVIRADKPIACSVSGRSRPPGKQHEGFSRLVYRYRVKANAKVNRSLGKISHRM